MLVFFAGVGLAVFNFQFLKDTYLAMTFEPSEEILSIKDKLNLTENGNRIFLASAPTLNSADEFNIICNADNTETSTLGCFTNQKIYIYNIESEELAGVKESTSAHELLHAIWSRLSTADKENLIPTLESVYKKGDKDFKDSVENYEESARIEEIYVRSATQIKDLPENLETHYAKYFNNQDKIVDYYNSYIEPFNTIKAELDTLEKELKTLNDSISAKNSEYDTRITNLSREITEFNSCASTVGCFADDASFFACRSELLSEQSNLDALFDSLNSDIEFYNEKVKEYNENVIHGKELNSIIDSKSKSLEEIK